MSKTNTPGNSTTASHDVDVSVTTDHVSIQVKDLEFPKLESELEDAIKEKGLEEAMMFGPESFEDLDELRDHNEKQRAITNIVSDFMGMVGNIFSWPGSGKSKKVKELATEMIDRLPDDDEELVEEEEIKEVDSVEDAKKSGFFVWKEASGAYRWLGVYSNKYRDDDRPAEILSEQAHLDFISRVEKGELPYPDLCVWHIKESPIGVTDMLAYDDAGFSIASGTMEEGFALALEKTSEDLAMSHGMPSESIVRSKEDPTVITGYVSTEVSVLPRNVAANKRTDFHIMKEEATMSIVPAEKRQLITELLGEDLTARLETDLDGMAKEAEVDGIEFKEESVETETAEEGATTEAQAEVPAESPAQELAEPEVPAEEGEEKEEAEEAEAEGATEDVPAATLEGDVGEKAADGNTFVDKEELAETLATIVGSITDSNQVLLDAIKGLSARVDAIEESDTASTQAGEQLAGVPMASLKDMLTKQLAQPAKSVIGTKEAAVHGNAKLNGAKPKETEYDEENPDPNSGLFFHRW
jgi:hypothetical protein